MVDHLSTLGEGWIKRFKFLQGHSPFFRLASNAFPDIEVDRSSNEKKEKKKKIIGKFGNRRPETPASLLWSLETARHGYLVGTNPI